MPAPSHPEKRQLGQFFTAYNPFDHKAFDEWASQFSAKETVLEPFAGSNALIPMARERGLAKKFASFDIQPQSKDVQRRDTLANFPAGYRVCITNPPYLAKNAATRLKADIPDLEGYDNLWKLSVSRCLANCEYVAAIIPESFLTSGLFSSRLHSVISLQCRMFDDTEQPVCLALWNPSETKRFVIYRGRRRIGTSTALQARLARLLPEVSDLKVVFGDIGGQVGIRAVDGHKGPEIAFVPPEKIPASSVKWRHLTRARVDTEVAPSLVIARANEILAQYRDLTGDVFLTSFRGLMDNGMFRRRLDWGTARRILDAAVRT